MPLRDPKSEKDELRPSLADDPLTDPVARPRSSSIGGSTRQAWRSEQGLADPELQPEPIPTTKTGKMLGGGSGAQSLLDPKGQEWVVKRGAAYGGMEEAVHPDVGTLEEV